MCELSEVKLALIFMARDAEESDSLHRWWPSLVNIQIKRE